MCRSTRAALPVVAGSAGAARDWIRDELRSAYGSGGSLIDDVALVVTELVSNAVHARASTLVLDLEAHHEFLRLSATDDARGLPEQRAADERAPSGRGLSIIAALSLAWGVTTAADGPGKTVWAELGPVVGATPGFACTRTTG